MPVNTQQPAIDGQLKAFMSDVMKDTGLNGTEVAAALANLRKQIARLINEDAALKAAHAPVVRAAAEKLTRMYNPKTNALFTLAEAHLAIATHGAKTLPMPKAKR